MPERFLRQLWKHQTFRSSGLHTTDGKSVEIFSPGTLNRDGGPDFIHAAVRIGGTLYRGDIELHQQNDEWTRHFHQNDPKYNSVILHVVLHANHPIDPPLTESQRALPVLILDEYLNAPYHEVWNSMILNERNERMETIKCSTVNDSVNPSIIKKWIGKLAIERIELKIRTFDERLKELIDTQRGSVQEPPARYDVIPFGIHPDELPSPMRKYSLRDIANKALWEQLLYEGVMESLGYSKNQQPFLRLARNVSLQYSKELLEVAVDVNDMQLIYEALLFTVSGLLPLLKDIKSNEGKDRVRQIHKAWNQMRAAYHREYLLAADWQFFRLRPENFPTLRTAGAARLLQRFHKMNFLKSIIHLIKNNELSIKQRIGSLEELFVVPTDSFWSQHYRFEEQSQQRIAVLIGKSRANDILLNVVIPLCLLYARLFKDKDVRRGALSVFEHCPSASSNSVTRMIDTQLIKEKFTFSSAMLQQGAIQLYKSFCSQERCSECAVGKTVFRTQ